MNKYNHKSLLDSLPTIVIEMDESFNIEFVNKTALNLLGYTQKYLINKNLFELFTAKEKLKVEKDIQEIISGSKSGFIENNFVKKDNSKLCLLASYYFTNDSNGSKLRMVAVDITERKKAEKRLKYLSFHDKLTKLFNRAYFEVEMNRLDTERQLPISFIIGDVDGLKIVNDSLGYRFGDKLLVEASKVIKSSFRKEDIVARWGGDEFVAILPQTKNEDAIRISERIEKNSKNIFIGDVPISISLGISTKIKVSQNLDEIIKEAEDRMRRRKMLRKESVHSAMIQSLSRALHEKSIETEKHTTRLKDNAARLGKTLGLSASELDDLSLISVLHDIGKIAIADSILLKKGKLTRIEWQTMKKHPMIGYKIALSSPQMTPIAKDILYHHEWWDGSGYPEGLKETEIPLISRIISIVDAYDVMRMGRPYKQAMSITEAIDELTKCSGTQFDQNLIEKFIEIIKVLNNSKIKS
jgi:diguanylate cyclase (GGDEF)-like protein/PAS domain S-box-containing protein